MMVSLNEVCSFPVFIVELAREQAQISIFSENMWNGKSQVNIHGKARKLRSE
jgi:hypothetical protein